MVTTIRLPDELHRRLKAEAEKKGLTLNGYLVSILWKQGRKVNDIYEKAGKEG